MVVGPFSSPTYTQISPHTCATFYPSLFSAAPSACPASTASLSPLLSDWGCGGWEGSNRKEEREVRVFTPSALPLRLL